MPSRTNVKYLLDIKTGVLYAALMSEDKKEIKDIRELGEVQSSGRRPKSVYGKTAYYIELGTQDDQNVDIYTLKWPSSEDFDNKVMPMMAVKSHPGDLVRAGIAKMPEQKSDNTEEENDAELQKAMESINKLIGLDEVKKKLRKQIALTRFAKLRGEILKKDDVKKPSLHMVFDGNPGTGKTTVAREYGKMLKAMGLLSKGHCVEVTRKDLVAGYIGQSEEKTQKKIEEAKGGVLFIDEAYALIVDGSDKDFGKQVVDQIVAEMENNRDDLVVIVAGYTEPMKKFINSNPGLKRRFVNYVHFSDFNEGELSKIIDFMSDNMDVVFAPEAKAAAVEKILTEKQSAGDAFGNAGTVRNLVELAFENAAYRVMEGKNLKDLRKLPKKELEAMVKHITLEDVQGVDLAGFGQDATRTGRSGFDTSDLEEKPRNSNPTALLDFAERSVRPFPVNDDVDSLFKPSKKKANGPKK